MSKAKVFGIGFQKTGTSSLGVVLDRLGYRIASYHSFRDFAGHEGLTWKMLEDRALKIASEMDGGKDTPWPLLYRDLDHAFPGSKFIHVIRAPDAWIRSAVKDFASYPNEIHRLIYGVPYPAGHEQIWLERYERHNAEVAAYFSDRPEDYLQIRLEDGITYEKICPFLGHEMIEHAPPPRANTWLNKRLKTMARRFGWRG